MVRGHFLALRHVTMTMEELLVTLIKRANVECEESHRLRVAASNGLAALHIIKEEWQSASEKYRDVLRYYLFNYLTSFLFIYLISYLFNYFLIYFLNYLFIYLIIYLFNWLFIDVIIY